MRNEGGVVRISISNVKIEEAVIIYVAEVRSHRHVNLLKANVRSNVLKCPIPLIVIQLRGQCIVRQIGNCADAFIHRNKVTVDQKVRPAVVVVVEKPAWERVMRSHNPSLTCDFTKRVVVVIVIKEVIATVYGDIKIR